MTDAGWGADAPDASKAADKRIAKYAADVKKLRAKFGKLHAELADLVAANPLGEMLKCKDVGLQARLQVQLKEFHEELDGGKTPAYNAYECLRKQVIPPIMENAGIETVKITGVGRVDLRSDIYASTTKGTCLLPPLGEDGKPVIGPLDKDGEPTKAEWEMGDLNAWLATVGAADLITETVNASSLKALLRQKMREGVEIPAALIDVKPYTFAAITKG